MYEINEELVPIDLIPSRWSFEGAQQKIRQLVRGLQGERLDVFAFVYRASASCLKNLKRRGGEIIYPEHRKELQYLLNYWQEPTLMAIEYGHVISIIEYWLCLNDPIWSSVFRKILSCGIIANDNQVYMLPGDIYLRNGEIMFRYNIAKMQFDNTTFKKVVHVNRSALFIESAMNGERTPAYLSLYLIDMGLVVIDCNNMPDYSVVFAQGMGVVILTGTGSDKINLIAGEDVIVAIDGVDIC